MPLDTAFEPVVSTAPPAVRAPRCIGAGPVVLEFVHALRKDVTTVRGPEGVTIGELLRAAGVHHRRWGGGVCTIEDADRRHEPVAIARRLWDRVRPKAGTITTVMLWPGKESGGGKQILTIVLMVVVMVVAVALGQYYAPALIAALGETAGTAAAAAITTVVSIVGNLIISALIPPPKPRTPEERLGGLAADRSAFFLQGSSNRARPYSPVPLHLGKLRRFPDLGAEWFTEIVGNDQYLRGFLPWGLGPLKVSDIKIGDQPLAQFDGVEIRTVEGWADDGPPEIYTNDPHTDGFSIELTNANGWQERTTQPGIDEYQVEYAFPDGLANFNPVTGEAQVWTVTFDAEEAPFGTDDWAPIAWTNSSETGFGTPGEVTISDATRSGQPRRVGRRKVTPGTQWRIRTRRTMVDNLLGAARVDRSFWASLRSIQYKLPIAAHLVGRLAYSEIRIKATNQLNGVIQELNGIVESYAREIDENGFVGAWEVPRTNWIVTRNNALLFAHVANHWSALKPIPPARMNWLNLVEWRDACDELAQDGLPRFTYDRVFEGESTLARILDEIASAGRARRGMPAGRHGVIRDVPQSAVKQHFTPRNSSGFRIDIAYRRRLHGVRVRYNKDGLGQEAEITVYDDGYSAANAVELETAEAIGWTREGQVWRDFRYWLAVQRLRPHTYELATGVEHLRCGRGALVRGTHDVVRWGLESGRLRSATQNDDDEFVSVALDTKVTMEAGKNYGIRFRNPKGSFYVGVATAAGEQSSLTFLTPQAESWDLREGDLFGFGEADRDSVELIVNGVAPSAHLNATLKLLDAAPAVHTADTGTIPEFDPQITVPPPDARAPAEPVIRAVKSDESVMIQRVGGALVVRVLVELGPVTGQPMPDWVQGRWRPNDASPWSNVSQRPASGLLFDIEGPPQGQTITIELRHITNAGAASNWKRFTHTVIGKTTLPPDVPGLFHEGAHIRWQYPNAPLDVTHGGGFRVRYHYGNLVGTPGIWANANGAHDDLIAGAAFATALLPPGELTVLVKAIDADGNESAAAAELFTEIVAPALANVVETYDFRAAGWPGTIESGVISGGDIIADSSTLFWGPDAQPFWGDDADPFWDAVWDTLVYQTTYAPPATALPARLTLASEIEGAPQRKLYRIDERLFWGPLDGSGDGDPFWGADGDLFWQPEGAPDWREWPGHLDLAAADDETIEVRIEAGGGPSAGALNELVATLDAEDVGENLYNVAISAGGTTAPVTKTYRKFVHAVPVLLDDGGAARGVRIVTPLPSDTSPEFQCFDAAGVACDGHINITPIQGY